MLFRKTLIPTIRKVIGDSVLRRGFKRKSLYKESKLHEAKKNPSDFKITGPRCLRV